MGWLVIVGIVAGILILVVLAALVWGATSSGLCHAVRDSMRRRGALRRRRTQQAQVPVEPT